MGKSTVAKLPKAKCCVSSSKCSRCPLRMLKEGTLPEGYGVKKRVLVKVDPDAQDLVRPAKKDSKKDKSSKKASKKARKKAERRKQAARADRLTRAA